MTESSRPRVVVVAGPTAAGKSALALRLAEQVRGEIVVADSRQVYRGMDIGTAKAPAEVRERVRHHAVDVVDPGDRFDASMFRDLALSAIHDATRRRVPMIVEGGTGLYLRALVLGLVDMPSRDDELRERLRLEAEREGWPALHARLAKVDPPYASRIQPTDPVRITRALEVYELTGKPMSAHLEEHGFKERPLDVLGVLVEIQPATHRHNIRKRVELMWHAGLLDETRALIARVGEQHPLVGTINYAQAAAHLRGEIDVDTALERMAVKTSQFAKRQRTWFRKEPWLRPLAPDAHTGFLEEAGRFLTAV
ncbi:MAG: tRNA (adenosine(37)-N6)-dimethylallyltransferase MiaA [Myxococcota bacterium]